jgi:hypothetical protein
MNCPKCGVPMTFIEKTPGSDEPDLWQCFECRVEAES